MKGRHCWLALAALLAVVLLLGVVARAAESGDPAGDKPKAEQEQTPGEDQPKAEKKDEAEKPTLEQRLKNLQAALDKWVERHLGRIPRSIDQLVDYLEEKEKGLINPDTDQKIVMNEKMAGMSSQTIAKPAEFVTFYSATETAGKGRATIFGDGKVKYLDNKTFTKMLGASVATRMRLESTDIEEMRVRRSGRRNR